MTGSLSSAVFWDPAFILLSVSPFPPFVELAMVVILQSLTVGQTVSKTAHFGRWVNVLSMRVTNNFSVEGANRRV